MVRVQHRQQRGFTLLELMVTFTVAGLLMAVSVPSGYKMYQSMQYRGALADVRRLLEAGRYQALISGQSVDVVIVPDSRKLFVTEASPVTLPERVRLDMNVAEQLMQDSQTGVIRFYPDGSSSGGSVMVQRVDDSGVKLQVGWLMGELNESRL